MMDRRRRTVTVSGKIPRVERQANDVISPADPTQLSGITSTASLTTSKEGGHRVYNNGVEMIVAKQMVGIVGEQATTNYYGHETNTSFQLTAPILLYFALFLLY